MDNFSISQDQIAFILNRAIQDDIIIGHEVFRYLKTSCRKSYAIEIKLDMHKAYDKME